MSKNIDHIFYINLDKRTDRRAEFESTMNEMDWNSERFPGIYCPPPRGIVGCTKSHLGVLKLAKERNYHNILIFEDDFEWIEPPIVVEEELTQLFTNKPDFDVCFLSYNLKQGSPDKKCPFLIKTEYSTTASAYIVNRHYYDTLISLYEDCIPKLNSTMKHWLYANDQVWRPLQENDNWYCIMRRLGKQRDGFSDNANGIVKYNC
jgi:glycosyl transferase family 25